LGDVPASAFAGRREGGGEEHALACSGETLPPARSIRPPWPWPSERRNVTVGVPARRFSSGGEPVSAASWAPIQWLSPLDRRGQEKLPPSSTSVSH
jgi:hypothetical protein